MYSGYYIISIHANSKSTIARLSILWNKIGHLYPSFTTFLIPVSFFARNSSQNPSVSLPYRSTSFQLFCPQTTTELTTLDILKPDHSCASSVLAVFLLFLLAHKYSHPILQLPVFILFWMQAQFVTLWSKHWFSWPS